MWGKLTILLSILIVLSSFTNVSAYPFTSIYQDDASADHINIPPSFYSSEGCEMNMTLYATATHSGSYVLNNKWYNPNVTLIGFSNPTFTANIVCRNLGTIPATGQLSDIYETRTTTQSSATTEDTWTSVQYDCDADADDIVTYENTMQTDSYGAYPYSYIRESGGYCQVGSPGSIPTTANQLINVVNYLSLGYYTDCGSDLLRGSIDAFTGNCALNRFYGITFWTVIPFNSMDAGIVNITVTDQDLRYTGTCSMSCTTNKIYLWDTVVNGTSSIGSSIPHFSEEILIENRDYWLFIGSECTGTTGGGRLHNRV